MASLNKQDSQFADSSDKPMIGARQSAVADVVDALDGATLTGDTVTTSATPTVTELEACVGVLGGKVNAIITVLEAHGLIESND